MLRSSRLKLLGSMILGLFLVSETVAQESIFPDKALEKAVRKEVFAKRYNDEPITAEDVKNISQVKGKGLGIKSLEGLEHCVAVMLIDLEDNEIEDLTPLAELKLLQSINLADNRIRSVKPLEKLERVQYLELSNNQVKNIESLAKMTNMRSLYLSNNRIKHVDVLLRMPKVWTLYVAENPIVIFEPIGHLSWLSSFDASECNIKSLEFMKPLTELKYVNLKDNEIEDLAPLVEMAKGDDEQRFAQFWRLYIEGNPLGEKAEEQLASIKEMGGRINPKN